MVTAPQANGVPDWLSAHYPFSPKSFQTPQGARMSYLDEGPAGDEAVLMLHGNPTWSFFYRDLVRELSPGIRCIAPDQREAAFRPFASGTAGGTGLGLTISRDIVRAHGGEIELGDSPLGGLRAKVVIPI